METAVWDLKSQFEKYRNVSVFDCMVAEFLLSEGRFIPTQETALKRYGVSTVDELAEKQQEKLSERAKLQSLFIEIEMPLISVLYQMEQTGITINTKTLKHVGEDIDIAINATEDVIRRDVGVDMNLNSSVQIGNFLAEKLGVPLAKTKTGKYATNENEIAQYADTFPLIKDLLSYRELSKRCGI